MSASAPINPVTVQQAFAQHLPINTEHSEVLRFLDSRCIGRDGVSQIVDAPEAGAVIVKMWHPHSQRYYLVNLEIDSTKRLSNIRVGETATLP